MSVARPTRSRFRRWQLERVTIRIGTAALLLAACLSPIWMTRPAKLPAEALGSAAVLYIEQAFALLLFSLIVLTVVVQGLLRAVVPTKLSRDGIEWAAEVSTHVVDLSAALDERLTLLEEQMEIVGEQLGLSPPAPDEGSE